VDALITGSYKWLCSLFGAAACYLSPQVLEQFRPPLAGWRSTEHPYARRERPASQAGLISAGRHQP
jgi:selenocysteine lyase/cysteine desulfurase